VYNLSKISYAIGEKKIMPLPYKRVQVIINPAAGKNDTILNTINGVFSGSDIEWDARITHKFGDATRLAREAVVDGADLVAGYGGDGTQLEVANGLVGSGVPMAILPGGTGNAMAFQLNVPRDLMGAVSLIVNSTNRKAIDLASIGDRVFMLRAYTGVQAEERASREMKDKYGNLAYVAEGLKFAARPPEAQYKATIDGQTVEGKGMICYIVNAGASGGIALPELPGVDVSDGLLDFYVVSDGLRSIRNISRYVLKVGSAKAGVYHWQGREITLEADPAQNVWIDGEQYGQTPITAKVLPKALEVVVPERS
jgi:YegS/Rv2252/BmrU family lipid kinase